MSEQKMELRTLRKTNAEDLKVEVEVGRLVGMKAASQLAQVADAKQVQVVSGSQMAALDFSQLKSTK